MKVYFLEENTMEEKILSQSHIDIQYIYIFHVKFISFIIGSKNAATKVNIKYERIYHIFV